MPPYGRVVAAARACAFSWAETAMPVAGQQFLALDWSPTLALAVAVAQSGVGNRVVTSPDGITWTNRVSAADNVWTGIAWSPTLNLFAAVAGSGVGNRVMTSPDGITWTARASAADNNWTDVIWATELGLFVAVAGSGVGNRVMTSPDGITWTTRASAADNSWQGVAWSPTLALLAAVSTAGANTVMTSPDGIVWTVRASTAPRSAIIWYAGLNLFISSGLPAGGNGVSTSPDGIVWTVRATPQTAPTPDWVSIAGSTQENRLIALEVSNMQVDVGIQSTNGTGWALVPGMPNRGWRDIVWAPELTRFIAVSDDGFSMVSP